MVEKSVVLLVKSLTKWIYSSTTFGRIIHVSLTSLFCGLYVICRLLRDLDLQENEIDDHRGQWLNCFPDSCTSLVSLNIACLKGDINLGALERLVARSPNLKSLKLNRAVPLDTLQRILVRTPQLTDLGTGSFVDDPDSETYSKLKDAVSKCRSITSLSGFLEAAPQCLPAVYPLCSNLTSLNLSYAVGLQGSDLIKLIRHCVKLQRLWVSILSLRAISIEYFPYM